MITERDGAQLFYLDEGKGTPLLLLHAFPVTSEAFRPQTEGLRSELRIVAPDQRGFGKSTLGTSSSDMSTLAEDAFAVLDAARIDSAFVGGVSMGGYVAMAMLRVDPSRILGLVLADTHPFADDAARKQKREENAKATLERGLQFQVETLLPKLLAQPPKAKLEQHVKAMMLGNPPEGSAAALLGMGRRADSRELLARFGGPALVITGEKDAIAPPEMGAQMAALMGRARSVVIPGVGHFANLEAPEAFNEAVLAFLRTAHA